MGHRARFTRCDPQYARPRRDGGRLLLLRLVAAAAIVAGTAWVVPAAAAVLQFSGGASQTVDESAGTVSLSVALVSQDEGFAPTCTIQGKLVSAGGSATAGADYDVSGSSFTITVTGVDGPPPMTIATGSATVSILDDATVEATETADLQIAIVSEDCSGESDGFFVVNAGTAPATISIVDNDEATPPASVSSLTLNAFPGQTTSAQFTASDESPPIFVSTDLEGASVTPEVIEGSSGTVTFSFPVPASAQVGDTISGSIRLQDSASEAGNVTTIPVTIHVGSAIASDRGLTDNQRRTATALDSACGAIAAMSPEQRTPGQQDLLNTCKAVQSSDSPGALIDQLSQEEVATQRRITLSTLRGQLGNVGGRLNNLRHGASGLNISGLNLQLNGNSVPGSLLQYAANGVLRDVDGREADLQKFDRLGVYVNGSVVRGSRDGTDREEGYDTDIWNLTVGTDYRFTDRWVAGVASGYGHTDTQIDNDSGGVDLDSYTLSLYGSYYHPAGYYLDAIATYGRNNYDVSRELDLDGSGLTADGSPNGNQYLFSVDGGYDITHKALTIGLQARATYLTARIDGYDETPSNAAAPGAGSLLHIDSQAAYSLTSELLVQISYAISTPIGVILPTTRVGWEHEFRDDSQFISANFLNDPTSTTFKVRTDNPDRDYFNIGAGLSAQFAQGRSAFLFVETTQGRREIERYAIQGGVRLSF